MCDWDVNSNQIGSWKLIAGRYNRTFIGQSTGSMVWKVESPDKSQTGGHNADRTNASEGKKGQANYKNAVFATDKELQSIDWPIKSGYFFDPIGIYTCTVKTAQYKDSTNYTEEHEELVEKVKASFRYSSEIQYVTASKDVITLFNISEEKQTEQAAAGDNEVRIKRGSACVHSYPCVWRYQPTRRRYRYAEIMGHHP
jgi:hypothetical protein